jgi:hypothetical protein
MTTREWRGGASGKQTEVYKSLVVNELGRSHGGPTERQLLTTVAEVREPLEGTFSLNLSAIPEFDRAIARFGPWTWRRPARGHYHRGTKETAMAWTVLLGAGLLEIV